MAAWPFFVPQFFPEMARLGNDSLCLLVMGGVWACLLALLPARQGRPWVALGLGALLGAGLLTKAFFQPIGAGVALLLASRLWQTRSRVAALDLALALGAALLIGGGWYLAKWHATGSLIGSDEFIRMNREGGLWSALQDDFSGLQFLRGLWGIVASFLWGGTWSQVTVSPLILAPLILLLALPVLRWAKGLPKGDRVHWAPLALAVPMAAGLGYHVLVWLAGYGAETPGWYFHILAAPLGFAVASGWRASRGMAVLVASAAVIADGLWACQISMFSGCIGPLGADRGYNLGHAACLVDGRTLSRVAFPVTGALSLATGVGLALLATTLVFRAARTAQATDPLGVSTPTSDTDI